MVMILCTPIKKSCFYPHETTFLVAPCTLNLFVKLWICLLFSSLGFMGHQKCSLFAHFRIPRCSTSSWYCLPNVLWRICTFYSFDMCLERLYLLLLG